MDYFVQQLGRGLIDIHERNTSRGLKSIFDFDMHANLESQKDLAVIDTVTPSNAD